MKQQRIRLGDLTVGSIHSLAAAIREHGQDPAPLLQHYGLDAARLADPRGRLSIPRYMRLGHAAIQLTGDPALGLQMGQQSRFAHFGLIGITAALSPNVREAARAITRFELGRARRDTGDATGRAQMEAATQQLEAALGTNHPTVRATRSWLK